MVVPTHNRAGSLGRLLHGLAAQTLEASRWNVFVVDDGSSPTQRAAIEEAVAASPTPARLLRLEPARGPATARNHGWRTADAPLIAFIDDDCVPHPEWLVAGLNAFERHRTGVVQGRTIIAADRPVGNFTPFTVVREILRPSPWFEGCNIFYRRAALEDVGGFDESFGTFPGGEDTNLGWAVVDSGWERAWADDAVVEHEVRDRSWWWHLRFHWLEGNLVRLAHRHPAIRSAFWRPWAVKRENALFAAAVAGLLAGTGFPPALLATVPYVVWLGPGRKVGPKGAALQVSAHAASLGAKLAAGLRERTFLL